MKNVKPRKINASGFTFIEVLVVVFIISVLCGIIFPVFSAAREKGRQSSCLNNARQVGMALLQYVADSDENWPSGSTKYASGVGWAGQCYPYVKSAKVFHCPDDDSTTITEAGDFPVSFGYNRILSSGPTNRNVTATLAPSKTVLLFEVSHGIAEFGLEKPETFSPAGTGYRDAGSGPNPANWSYPAGSGTAGGFALYATGSMGGRSLNGGDGSVARHRGAAVYLACDGHVRLARPELVSSGGSSALNSEDGQTVRAAGSSNAKYVLTFSLR